MLKIFFILILSLFFLTIQKSEDVSITLLGKEAEQIIESFDFNNITEKAEETLGELEEHLNNYHSSTQEDKNNHLEKVELLYVIDGDTLFVAASDGTSKKVRLIGINCPESVHADESKNTDWGTMASNYTSTLLEPYINKHIYLEYDIETMDQYERILAYGWLSDDIGNINNMLNARILMDGYAVDEVFLPNNKYADTFARLCSEAQNNQTGLWEYSEFENFTN